MEVKHPQRHAGASPPSALHVVCVLLLLSLHRAVAQVGSNAPTVGQYQQALSSILTLEGAIRVGNISGTGTFLVQATSSVFGQLALLSANGINNTVVVSTGAFVNNLTGAGNITIGGNVTSVYVTNGVTQNTTISLTGTSNVTIITADITRGTSISVGPLATVSIITSSTFGPTTIIDGVVLQSTSTNSTMNITVRTGGVLLSHCQYGGTLVLSNNGGTVGTVCGYGTFNIQNGTVNVALNTSIINVGTGGGNSTTNSTSTNSTSPSSTANITFSGGASISTLSVNSSTTVLYLNGGFVEKIVLLSAVRSTTIVITNPNSSFGELHSMFDIDTLNILTSSSSNVVMMGALYVGGCASIFCRNVIFRSQAQPFLTIVAPPQITNISNVSLIITASQLTVSNVPVVLVRADIGLLLLNLTSVSIVASNSNSIVHLANVQIGQLQISFDDMIINGTNTMLFLADGPRTLIGASGATSSSSSLLQLTSVKITIEGVQLGSNTEQYAVISLVDGSFRNMSIGMTKCNVTVTSLRSVLYVGGNMQDGYIAFTFSTMVYPHTLLIIQGNTSENSNIDNLHSYGVENVSFIASNMTLTSSSASSNPSLLWCSGATIRNSSVVLSNNDLQFGLETSVVAFHDDASLLGSSIQLQGFTASQMNTSVVSLGGNVTDSTLVVVCAEIQTAFTSILAFDGVSTRTRVELHSVAIHRSSNFVSLINISHASSTSNTIRLIHTSAKVPVLIACAAGAAGVSNGIMTACSSVGTTPMSEGSFFPELVPLVSVNRGVCDVALHPSCWKTVTQSTTSSESPSAFISPTITAAPSAATFSLNNSFTHTSSASRSISLTDTISQSTTPSASLAQTHSSSHSSSRTESVSSSTTQTRLPTTSVTSNFSATTSHTVSLSPTVSPSKSKTPSATTVSPQLLCRSHSPRHLSTAHASAT